MTKDGSQDRLDPVEVVQRLRSAGKADRIEATRSYYPSSQENLGVYAKDIRAVVRDCSRRLRAESAAEVLRFARSLIARDTIEGRQCAYEILEAHRAAAESLGRAEFEELMRGVDNWVNADSLACSLTGQAWREGRLTDSDVEAWSRSEDPWVRRVALVSTVPLNMKSRGGSGDVERTLLACERALGDSHKIVEKALSWALRALVPIDAGAVRGFLEEHESELPAFVRREVGKKLETGKKSG